MQISVEKLGWESTLSFLLQFLKIVITFSFHAVEIILAYDYNLYSALLHVVHIGIMIFQRSTAPGNDSHTGISSAGQGVL
jgi:hypothetical protein